MKHILKLYSQILRFPAEGHTQKVEVLQKLLAEYNLPAEAIQHLQIFQEFLKKTSLEQQDEVYTQTFEVQSITTMDVGYVLFGDDYKRAELLVNLNQELARHNINPDRELADYLPNVLELLSVIKEQDLFDEIINYVVYPALHIIIREFDPEAMEKKNKVYLKHQKSLIEKSNQYKTIYLHPLLALKATLEQLFGAHRIMQEDNSKGFLKSVTEEMNIEKMD